MSNVCAFFELEITLSETCAQIKSYSDIRVGKEIKKENLKLRIQLVFIVHTLLQVVRIPVRVGTLLAIRWSPETSVFFSLSESELITMTSGFTFLCSFSLTAFPFLSDAATSDF